MRAALSVGARSGGARPQALRVARAGGRDPRRARARAQSRGERDSGAPSGACESVSDPNTELLVRMAEALGDLRERLVFVGVCATALLITDPAAAPVRATQDVDAVVAIASKVEYLRLGEALRARGFSQTLAEGEPPFRWTFAGIKLDVMPIDQAVLGFSNRWYESAMQTAVTATLQEGLSIRLVTATCFVA